MIPPPWGDEGGGSGFMSPKKSFTPSLKIFFEINDLVLREKVWADSVLPIFQQGFNTIFAEQICGKLCKNIYIYK